MTSKERALQLLQWVRKITNDILKDFPEDKATFQPTPLSNHALWTMGHLAVTDQWMLKMFGDDKTRLPPRYGPMFGYSTKPSAAASAYPSFAEVRRQFDAMHEAILAAARAASDASLEVPLGEKGGGFADDGLDALYKTVWHEGWHAGQLSQLRRELGLKGVF
jgi:uncharacterized damage-inducible protein DinB